MSGLEHKLSRTIPRIRLQANRPDLRAAGGPFASHRQERAHAPFVAGAAGLDPLAQPGLLAGESLVEFRLLHRFVGERCLLAAKEGRVVAGPRREPATIELDDASRDTLEEYAVVRDEHDCARTG